MDQELYKQTLQQMKDRPCLYEKGILATHCNCPHAHRFNLAEREGVACANAQAWQRCNAFQLQLQEHTRFLFKLAPHTTQLTHAQAIRLQIGGLQGLYHLLPDHAETAPIIDNIATLFDQIEQHFGSLAEVPLKTIVSRVAAFKARKRRSARE